ncbi:MAG: hypothetical protein RJA36_671 [Pseudomonadota bacterium]|jgi:hypothetical protein
MASMIDELDYSNFKSEVSKRKGHDKQVNVVVGCEVGSVMLYGTYMSDIGKVSNMMAVSNI